MKKIIFLILRTKFILMAFLFVGMGFLATLTVNAQTFKSLSVKEKVRLDPFLHFIADKDKTALKKTMGIMSVDVQVPEPTVDILIRVKAGVTRADLSQINSALKLRTQAGDIFTASMPINLLPLLAESDKIIFVSAVRRMHPKNNIAKSSNTDVGDYMGVAASQGLSGYAGVEGQGVIVGIVDYGIDFRHPDFLTADNKSRILYLWDQTLSGSSPSEFDYGTEWTKTQIDQDLVSASCRSYIGNCTIVGKSSDTSGHGTHVTGSATGGHAIYSGMAPKADIIFVKTNGENVIEGVDYIFQKAASLGKPAVVNLSLGTHFDPHDGTSNFDRAISGLIGSGKIVVAAAGNERDSGLHGSATIVETHVFNLTVKKDISTAWMNLWHDGNDQYSVSVKVNNGDEVIAYHGTESSGTSSGVPVYIIHASSVNPNNGDNEVQIRFQGSLTADWPITVTYTLTGGSGDKRVDGWCSGETSPDLQFDSPDNTMLICAPGTSTGTITVGAYVSRNAWTSTEPANYTIPEWLGYMTSFSSPGPTRDGRIKPDITAPGDKIISSLSQSASPANKTKIDDDHITMEGTSMAAPLVTGIIALHLQQNPNLTPDQMKTILAEHARTDSGTGVLTSQDNDWGYGKVLGTPPAWPKPENLSCTALSTVDTNWVYTSSAQNHLGFRVQDVISEDIYGDLASDASGFYFLNLSTNTSYSLQVSAFNDAGASTSAPTGCYTLAAQPTNFNLASVQLTSATVQWNANENPAETNYQVDYWTLGGSTTSMQVSVTSADVSGLTAFTTYYFSVSAKNGNNIFTSSSPIITALTLPAPPENFSGSAQGVSSITWTWDSVANATQYKFYPSTGGTAIALANPTLTQINLSTNTTYGARVSVLNDSGESGLSNTVTVYTLAAAPISPIIASVNSSSITISWDINQNPVGTIFTFELSENNFSSIDASKSTILNTDSFSSLIPNTNYFFRTKAKNENNIATAYTPVVSTITLANIPINLSLTQISSVSLLAVWQRNSNPIDTRFELSLSTDNFALNISTPLPFFGASAVTEFDLTGLEKETTYYARVRARNSTGHATDFITANYFIPSNLIQSVNPSQQANLIFANATLSISPQTFSETINVTMETPGIFPSNTSFAASLSGINSGIDITIDKDLLPLNNLKLTLTYSAAQAAGLNESEFLIARYEPSRAVWIPYLSSPNPTANQVTAFIDHLSLFQIMQAAPANASVLSSLKVFPNPVYLSRGQTMKFSNLPANTGIKIYTFKGELVRDLTANASGIAEWNGRNSSGQLVASEVYLALIKSSGGSKVVKVMVER